MIFLDKNNFMASGSHRRIYLCDDFPNKCLKVVFPEGQRNLKNMNTHWYKRIRPLSWFDENKKEIKSYKILFKKNNEIFEVIPRFYGIIKTNIGDAMLIDYVNNAISIKEYIEKYGLTEELKTELLKMFDILYKNNIQIRDPHLSNYMVQTLENGSIKIKIVDGIGNSQLIPLADYITYIGRIQITHRINKFINNLNKEFPQYEGILKFKPPLLNISFSISIDN